MYIGPNFLSTGSQVQHKGKEDRKVYKSALPNKLTFSLHNRNMITTVYL